MLRVATRPFRIAAYFAGWLVFAVLVLPIQVVSLLLLPWAGAEPVARLVGAMIHRHSRVFVGYLRATGLLRLHVDPAARRLPAGILVANHPGLIDALLLFAQQPGLRCIYKSSLRRHPLLSAIPRAAGFIANDEGIGLLRATAAAARRHPVLVFPEGTRTAAGARLNPLKPGFVLAARRAGVPVRILALRTGAAFLAKDRAWWHAPALPVALEIVTGPELHPAPARPAAESAEEVERALLALLPAAA